ncbi:hypothetical protein L1987_75098 [Smallanthus sonchifolius]|uniref:Uncharacterized protein n=1 Tax=Smallanthus sonchifolius TaxID=185202 RepID=A0ACB9A4I1_9ASTR|nr:hypothetical protein L1987_75098 [Smallanthus sonchifolius]
MFSKIDWKALADASKTMGYAQLPEDVTDQSVLDSDDFLQKFHHALLELHLEEGALVCPETGRRKNRKLFFFSFYIYFSLFFFSHHLVSIHPVSKFRRLLVSFVTSYTHTAFAVSSTIVSLPLRRLRISPIASDRSTPAHAYTVLV